MSVASTGSEQLKMKSQECPPPAAAEAAQLHPSIGSTAAAAANYDLELIDCCRNGNLRKLLEIKDSKNYSSQYLISTSSLWETSLLHWSLLAPNIDVANYLITIGFDVNCKDKKYNMTPLQTAICHSSIRMVDLLMRNGAKLVGVSRENPSKNSELFLAKIHNKFATLAYLLENGADVGQADGNGECFIHHVVQATIDKSCLPLVSLYSPQVVEDCPRNSQRLTPQDLCLKNRRLSSLFQMRAAGFPMRFSQNFKRSMVSKWFEDYFIRQNKPLQLATTYFTIFYICCIISFFTFKVSLMQSHPKYYITSLLIHSLTIL
ncbi:MAG: Palmitoyltransferase zdhhc13, variant 2 [Marteilia pararefringens]